jgi:TolB protein
VFRSGIALYVASTLIFATTAGAVRRPMAATPERNGQIAYVHDSELHLSNADGTSQRKVAEGVRASDPEWSPDGNRLAFASDTENGIAMIAFPAEEITQITRNATGVDASPTWSPDGSQIAFAGAREGLRSALYVVGADGSNLHLVVRLTVAVSDPAWSPGGRLIAFAGVGAKRSGLFVVRPDGTGLKRLTKAPTEDASPDWSPDGGKIAFTRFARSKHRYKIRLFTVRRNGDGLHVLRDDSPFPDTEPSWSPNGASIVFSTYRPLGPRGRNQLMMISRNGLHERSPKRRIYGITPAWQGVTSGPLDLASKP